MNTVINHIVALTYKPLLEKYLSKTRIYRYEDIRLEIPPQVFHPGFFFSTQLLLEYIKTRPLKGKKLLEPGCGSGLIAMVAAKRHAKVMATDINPVAIEYIKRNSTRNGIGLEAIQSDLFEAIPVQAFDIIAINPPYYKKDAVTIRDHAWFCGEKGEYFFKLFSKLGEYSHSRTEIIMVLFDGCDMEMIREFARANGFLLSLLYRRQNLLEKNYVFKIIRQ